MNTLSDKVVKNPRGLLPYSKMEILFEDEGCDLLFNKISKDADYVPGTVLALDYNHKQGRCDPQSHRAWNI